MRMLLVVSLIVSSYSALSQTVEYKTSGAPVSRVVADIAEQTGDMLTVHRDLANEIVVVSVKSVESKVFREKLADCVSGKWVSKGEELELQVDADLSASRRKQVQEDFAKGVGAHWGDKSNQCRIVRASAQFMVKVSADLPGAAGDRSEVGLRIDLADVPSRAVHLAEHESVGSR